MADEAGYRRLGKFCREQAALLKGEAAARWLGIAEEYEKLADDLRRSEQAQPESEDKK